MPKKSPVQEIKNKVDPLKQYYERSAGQVPTFIERRVAFGMAHAPFKVYCPDGWEATWADVPVGDPNKDEDFHRKINLLGYVLLRPEYVSDDPADVKDGKFYLPVPGQPMSVAGADAYGYPGANQVVLIRPKEVGDRIRKKQMEEYLSMLNSSLSDFKEASTTETKAPLVELATSAPEE